MELDVLFHVFILLRRKLLDGSIFLGTDPKMTLTKSKMIVERIPLFMY